MKAFSVLPVETEIFHCGEDLADFIFRFVPAAAVREKMILAVTSKIVSLAEKRLAPASEDKKNLVRQEADLYLGDIGYGCHLTVKHHLLIPSAGIDESNSEQGDFILYPQDPFASAEKLWRELKKRWNLAQLGVLLTDSHTSPLRRGVTGVGLSYWGFRGVRNMVGTQDLFGRELKMTQLNFVDGLAASAVMLMGEGQEKRPLALLYDSDVEFSDTTTPAELLMPLKEDLYYPLLEALHQKLSP